MTDLDHLSRVTQAALSPLTGLAKFEAHTDFDRATQPAAIAELIGEMRALLKDKERLDSGRIMLRGWDDFGDAYKIDSRGNDLRAMIDEAMAVAKETA